MKVVVVNGGASLISDDTILNSFQGISKPLIWSYSDDLSFIQNQNSLISNSSFDWSVYVFELLRTNDSVLLLNSTLFVKHPHKHIINKFMAIQKDFGEEFVVATTRSYRNGLLVSAQNGYSKFIPSFYIYLPKSVLFLLKDKGCLDLLSEVDKGNFSNVNSKILSFAHSHCYEKTPWSHYVSSQEQDDLKERKMRSVICEQIFSEFIIKEALVYSLNENMLDYFKYKIFHHFRGLI